MQSKPMEQRKVGSPSGNPPTPLFSVWGWEIRRVFAKPLHWGFGLASLLFFMAMMWFKHAWSLGTDRAITFTLYGTSPVGLLYEFTVVLMLVFAFMLPFVVTEGVAGDYKKRFHEVLMTTTIPTPAYIWGRFLAVLSIVLGQAVLMLLAAFFIGSILHQRNAAYPPPAWNALLTVWGLVVIPATILIAGVGFSLGTFWPRRTRMIMLGILIVWILFYTLGDVLRINPTGSGIAGSLIPSIIQVANANLAAIPPDQKAAWIQKIQASLPDLHGWLLPQSGLALAGLLCVLAAAAGFRRFRNELEK
jgi:ABC-type transport system involved in multi-copper enzyme maturation permease subunit